MDCAAHCLAGKSHVARELTAHNRKVSSRHSKWNVAVAGKTLPSNGPGPRPGPDRTPTCLLVFLCRRVPLRGSWFTWVSLAVQNTHVTQTVRMNSVLRILGGQRRQSESVESSAAGKYPLFRMAERAWLSAAILALRCFASSKSH